jgi:hypothetical protein
MPHHSSFEINACSGNRLPFAEPEMGQQLQACALCNALDAAIDPQNDNVSLQLAASQEALFLGLLVSNYSLERHDKNPLDIRHLIDI